MKKYLFAALALTAMVACSKDDVPTDDVLTSSEKSVFISIANMASDTRATGGITGGNATDVACATNTELVFLFADKVGDILVKKAWNDGQGDSATIRAFHKLPEQVTQVAVIAHYADYTAADFDNLSDADTAWKTQTDAIVEGALSSVVVYGVDTQLDRNGTCVADGETYAKMEASVTVAPYMSRIEIGQIQCIDLGTKYSKIGLENISFATGDYTYTFAGTFASDAALDSADDNVVLTSNSDVYQPNESVATDVLSWNITPRAVSEMILNMHVVGNGYMVQIPKKTVTINSYKSNQAGQNNNDNGTPLDTTDDTMTTFNSGQIYKINFNFRENNIDNNDILCVDVTVTIAEWVVNNVDVGFAHP